MQPQDTLVRLDQMIQSRSILNHPFYVAWQDGELSAEQLAIYTRVYYPHVAAFTGYLNLALGSAEDEIVRAELETNLDDECNNPKAHNELWLDFAEGLGVSRRSILNEARHPAAENIVNTFERLSRSYSAQALAALYAYESQQPEVSRLKSDGLRELYGVDDPKTLAYFECTPKRISNIARVNGMPWKAVLKMVHLPKRFLHRLNKPWTLTGDCWMESAKKQISQ